MGGKGKNQRLGTREEGDSGSQSLGWGGRRMNHGLRDKDKQKEQPVPTAKWLLLTLVCPYLDQEGWG